jgi:hypothetical protein
MAANIHMIANGERLSEVRSEERVRITPVIVFRHRSSRCEVRTINAPAWATRPAWARIRL